MPKTTASIAKQIGFIGYEKSISGDELMKLSDKELKKQVLEINLFTRMFQSKVENYKCTKIE
jgi:Ca2+-transporting ATPase